MRAFKSQTNSQRTNNDQSKHKETVKLLQNFIQNAIKRVSEEGKVGLKLTDAQDKVALKKQLRKAKIPVQNESPNKEVENPHLNPATLSLSDNDETLSE